MTPYANSRDFGLTFDASYGALHRANLFENRASIICQRHAIGAAIEKSHSDDGFEATNLSDNRRRVDPQQFSRLTEAAAFSANEKKLQIIPG
jgi:hypothetical protein